MSTAPFEGWNDIWLDPAFRAWNIEDCLPRIDCPTLVIQGADDEYGTTAQLDAIAAQIAGRSRRCCCRIASIRRTATSRRRRSRRWRGSCLI